MDTPDQASRQLTLETSMVVHMYIQCKVSGQCYSEEQFSIKDIFAWVSGDLIERAHGCHHCGTHRNCCWRKISCTFPRSHLEMRHLHYPINISLVTSVRFWSFSSACEARRSMPPARAQRIPPDGTWMLPQSLYIWSRSWFSSSIC